MKYSKTEKKIPEKQIEQQNTQNIKTHNYFYDQYDFKLQIHEKPKLSKQKQSIDQNENFLTTNFIEKSQRKENSNQNHSQKRSVFQENNYQCVDNLKTTAFFKINGVKPFEDATLASGANSISLSEKDNIISIDKAKLFNLLKQINEARNILQGITVQSTQQIFSLLKFINQKDTQFERFINIWDEKNKEISQLKNQMILLKAKNKQLLQEVNEVYDQNIKIKNQLIQLQKKHSQQILNRAYNLISASISRPKQLQSLKKGEGQTNFSKEKNNFSIFSKNNDQSLLKSVSSTGADSTNRLKQFQSLQKLSNTNWKKNRKLSYEKLCDNNFYIEKVDSYEFINSPKKILESQLKKHEFLKRQQDPEHRSKNQEQENIKNKVNYLQGKLKIIKDLIDSEQ